MGLKNTVLAAAANELDESSDPESLDDVAVRLVSARVVELNATNGVGSRGLDWHGRERGQLANRIVAEDTCDNDGGGVGATEQAHAAEGHSARDDQPCASDQKHVGGSEGEEDDAVEGPDDGPPAAAVDAVEELGDAWSHWGWGYTAVGPDLVDVVLSLNSVSPFSAGIEK